MSGLQRPKLCQFPTCKVKLGLTAFPCRCEKFYCEKHRLSEQHVCPYDYKKLQQSELNKFMSSPVVAAKLDKI